MTEDAMTKEELREQIHTADAVLVALGEEFDDADASTLQALQGICEFLKGKDSFVVNLSNNPAVETYAWPIGAFTKLRHLVSPLAEEGSEAKADADTHAQSALGDSPAWNEYERWLAGTMGRRLVMLELGVGLRGLNLVRFPFERIAFLMQKDFLIRVNRSLPQLPEELAEKALSVPQNSVEWILGLCYT